MTNTDKMNQAIETMMEMGFSRHLAEKALKATHYSSVHAAIDHLLNHPELTRSKNNNHKRHRRKSQTNNNNNNNNNNQNHHHKKNLNELVQEEGAEELEVNVNESSEEMDVNHNKDHTGSSSSNSNSSVSASVSVGSSSSSDSSDSSNNDHENCKYDESIAILIACENYANMEKLNGSLSAVRRLGHMLENGLGHYSERFPRVVYMLDDQVSSASTVLEQVRTSLSTVVNNGKMDVNAAQQNNAHQRNARVMIVLCGHSQVEQLKNSGTQEYFCCHGYRWGDESAGNKVHNALYYRDLLNVVEEYCDAKHVTLVFDCCFSRNLYSAENNNSIDMNNNKRQSPRVDSRSNLRRSMEEECKCVLASGVAEESVQQRREISPMIDCLSDALSTTWYTQHPDGYCTFNEIAAHVQQQLSKRGEQTTSSETTATSASDTIVKFGYLHEYKGGNMVFKLPTEYKLFDACPNSHMFEMRDSERWYNIQEFWPSGLYVGCWKNGVPNSEINLGWFTCPKNPLYSFHTFLAHKHGNKVIVYEFGVLDAVTRRARPESSVTAEALALGAPGCIVVTEWTINGRHVLPNPTLLYSEPSNCAGYITDLSSETDVEAPLAQIHWLRVTPRDAFQRASTNSVLDLSVLSGQCIPDPTSDVKWGGSETYMIASNNCHHYCYHLLCSLLSKRVEWPFLRLISKIK